MIDVEKTIISQYAESTTIATLIKGMNEHIDPRADIDSFFDYVWNVETAQGFGLDIWGRIVNIGRGISISTNPEYFGFYEAFPGSFPFNQAPFYDGITPISTTYLLADDAYRKLILTKALANVSESSAPAVNKILQNMFAGRGRCYVNDLGGMQMRYVFSFTLTPQEFAIITQSGVFPRPAGVGATMIEQGSKTFGFREAGPTSMPMGFGSFFSANSISPVA